MKTKNTSISRRIRTGNDYYKNGCFIFYIIFVKHYVACIGGGLQATWSSSRSNKGKEII